VPPARRASRAGDHLVSALGAQRAALDGVVRRVRHARDVPPMVARAGAVTLRVGRGAGRRDRARITGLGAAWSGAAILIVPAPILTLIVAVPAGVPVAIGMPVGDAVAVADSVRRSARMPRNGRTHSGEQQDD